MTPVVAGAVYFAIVFAIGFILGTIRVFGLAPATGETVAVLIESPFILGASWLACGFSIRRFNMRAETNSRLIMGAVAFAFLISAELTLGVFGFGQTPKDFMAQIGTMAGAVGLAGQILFGLFPLISGRRAD